MVARRDAAQATLDAFKDKPLAYGIRDCARMVGWHLRRCGYQVKLPPTGSYRTARGALRKLRALGHASLPDALDALGLERIVPAAALVGDIVQGPGDDALAALGVMLGNGRIVGYHEDVPGAAVLQPLALQAAWRVEFGRVVMREELA